MNSIRSVEQDSRKFAAHQTGAGESSLTAHEHIGFELGWDYAHYRIDPPAHYSQQPSPLRHGLLAGRATFGLRTLTASRAVRKWLQLRLNAWLRGRSIELFQVTPNYLQQINRRFCPITRVELSSSIRDSEASIDRVRNDAAYAAGNLAVMSRRANQAKGAHGFVEAMQFVRQLEDRPLLEIGGLAAAGWRRIAILCSFVEFLPHADACTLPLLVLPPRRLHMFNPVQSLQTVISCQLLRPGWARRSRSFEAMLKGKPQRRAYQAFFHAFLPRVLEAVPPIVRQARNDDDVLKIRLAIEDAWSNPLVLRCWTTFARLLDAAACERLLVKISEQKLGPIGSAALSDVQATEGWSLESRGYVPPAVMQLGEPALRSGPKAVEQICLPL